MNSKILLLFPVAILLTSCLSPQDMAIYNYCNAEAYSKYPESFALFPEPQKVVVGKKLVGSKRVCEKETVTKDANRKKDTVIERTVSTCKDQDIFEDIVETQMVPVKKDVNKKARENFALVCEANAKQAGMYSELNKK